MGSLSNHPWSKQTEIPPSLTKMSSIKHLGPSHGFDGFHHLQKCDGSPGPHHRCQIVSVHQTWALWGSVRAKSVPKIWNVPTSSTLHLDDQVPILALEDQKVDLGNGDHSKLQRHWTSRQNLRREDWLSQRQMEVCCQVHHWLQPLQQLRLQNQEVAHFLPHHPRPLLHLLHALAPPELPVHLPLPFGNASDLSNA